MKHYKVGLVVSKVGLSENQLLVVRKMLAEIAQLLDEHGVIELVVPGYDDKDPEAALPADVANLQYRHKVCVTFIGLRSHEGGHARQIRDYLEREPHCDEVWCCPALSQSGDSHARAKQVYRLGQQGPLARIYKTIAPWVEIPHGSEEPKPPAPKLPEGPSKAWEAPAKKPMSKGKARKAAARRGLKEKRAEEFRSMFKDGFTF